MFSKELTERAEALLKKARAKRAMIGAAESCTGGLLNALLTEVPGASETVAGGFVTYSNAAKATLLGVPEALLTTQGAVSEAVARAMADGGRQALDCDVLVSITGIAGPGGGTQNKPIGLVHFACAARGGETLHAEQRFGDLGRAEVRLKSVSQALAMLSEGLNRLG